MIVGCEKCSKLNNVRWLSDMRNVPNQIMKDDCRIWEMFQIKNWKEIVGFEKCSKLNNERWLSDMRNVPN